MGAPIKKGYQKQGPKIKKTQKEDIIKLPKIEGMPEKVRRESLMIELLGDLVRIYKKDPKELTPMKKFDDLSSHLINLEKTSRLIIYKCICALSLTAHARQMEPCQERKDIFELKNQLFLSIVNHPNTSRIVNLRKGISERSLVREYCPECKEKNGEKTKKDWVHCEKCTLEKGFFDVLSLSHKFDLGSVSCFLGQEHLHRLKYQPKPKEIPLSKIKELIVFQKIQIPAKDWIALDLKSVIKVAQKLITL